MGIMDFRPYARVVIDGIPLSGLLFSQISSISVTDTNGLGSDTAEITFENTSPINRIAMPEPGAEIEISMGSLGNFKKMGSFVADEVEEESNPRMITILARAKVHGETKSGKAPINQQKTRSWEEGQNLKAIVEAMAGENGLKVGVTPSAARIVPGHIDQIDESDISVLTRIAVAHDLIAKPTGGTLFVGRRDEGIRASGTPTETTTIPEASVSRWNMRRRRGEATSTVIATYRDVEAGKDVEVKFGSEKPERRLRQRFRSEDEAKAAAENEARRASRSTESLEVEMPGNPSIAAEGKVIPLFFSEAASGEWIVQTVTHELSSGGFRTSFQAQRPA